jgi:hypothetical protein
MTGQLIAVAGLKDKDTFVRRHAAEALVRLGLSVGPSPFVSAADVYPLLNDSDRFVPMRAV